MSRRSYPRAIAPSFLLFRKTTKSSSNGDLKSFNPLLKRYTRALYNPCSLHNLTTYKKGKCDVRGENLKRGIIEQK